MKALFLPLVFLMLFTQQLTTIAQTKKITGTVTDKDTSKPLPGVAVISGSGKQKTTTDINGKYSIGIAKEESSLVFSYVGYKKAIIKLNKDAGVINVALAQDRTALEELSIVPSPAASAAKAIRSESRFDESERAPMRKSVASVRPGEKPKSTGALLKSKPKDTRPQSNQLTAGEWNDLENWDFWTSLTNNQEWSQMQSYWSFYPKNRVNITLKNKQQQPLNNYTITALQNGVPLWKAKSNFEGKAELWPFLYLNSSGDITLEISNADGEKLYRKDIAKNVRKLEVTLDRPARKIKNLDVLFMVDATGSMGDEIDYLKSELEDIIGRLDGNNLKTRTSLVFYRDHGDEYLIRDFGFDQNIQHVKQNLAKQEANGGGDFEEAVEEAMQNAIFQQQWTTEEASAKIMFMVLDAPPHHDATKIKSIQKSVKEAAAKGIAIIPVVASGIDKNTEFLMRFTAIGTNGTYVFLTDDSGIGNSHLKPTTGSYQIEHLNQLLNRLIKKYSGL